MRSWLLVALCAVPISNAVADWQFTKWGMTPEEVSASSHGELQPTQPNERENRGGLPLLKMEYQSRDFRFSAKFVFNKQRRLSAVILDPLDMGECGQIQQSVLSQYDKAEIVTRSPMSLNYAWRDHSHDNRVTFSNNLPGQFSYCVIAYESLAASTKSGL